MLSVALKTIVLCFMIACIVARAEEAQVKAIHPNATHYTAGVVEFRPVITGSSTGELVKKNLKGYLEIINSAEANETDILVFPEGSLNNAVDTSYVPSASENIAPCDTTGQYADFLVELSCAARNVSKYVVINLTEKENCPAPNDTRPCANTGLNIYNTNVVFDRNGTVISRYRKVHVYLEPKNTTVEPEFGIFDTDFGVRFGHFICFDILFYTPAEELVDRFGIKDFIFTNWFYSELPFLTAVQMQHSWAWGNNVNMLSAGTSLPQYGTTGTGIYAGTQGDLVSVMAQGTGLRKLYVAKVPKFQGTIYGTALAQKQRNPNRIAKPTRSGIALMRDPRIEHFNSDLIDFTQQRATKRRICFGEFCCQFNIETEPTEGVQPDSVFYKYRIGVFEGNRTYEKEEWSHLRICALYACTDNNVTSCGYMFNAKSSVQANFVFKSVHIEADFSKAEKLHIAPNTLTERLYPLTGDEVGWRVAEKGNYLNVQLNSTVQHDDLLTFSIYANYYDNLTSGETAHIAPAPVVMWSAAAAYLARHLT